MREIPVMREMTVIMALREAPEAPEAPETEETGVLAIPVPQETQQVGVVALVEMREPQQVEMRDLENPVEQEALVKQEATAVRVVLERLAMLAMLAMPEAQPMLVH